MNIYQFLIGLRGKFILIFLIFAAFLLISVGIFSACEKEENAGEAYLSKEGRVDINETEFVRIYFYPEGGFINSPIELVFENNTKGILTYGNEFSLEYYDKENWTEIKLDIMFPDNLLLLEAGEIRKGQFNLSLIKEYNNGKKGKYRYVRRFGVSYSPSIPSQIGLKLYVEFEIK